MFEYFLGIENLYFCRFGHVYHNLQYRLTRTLFNAFLDPSKAMTQHYGAIQGLAALGTSVVFSVQLSCGMVFFFIM